MAGPATRESQTRTWADLKDLVHAKLVSAIDLDRVASIPDPRLLGREFRSVVERLTDAENPLVNRMERKRLVDEVLDDAIGFGPLEILFQDEKVREIRVQSPGSVLVRQQESLAPAETVFRSLEQLYVICGRLLSVAQGERVEPPIDAAVELEVPPDFLMAAQFPASRLQSPILHFRRLSEPPAPPKIPTPTLSRRDLRLLIRFVKTLHEAGLNDLSRIDEHIARPIAEHVVDEFFKEENQTIAAEVRAAIVDAILDEALHGSSQ
jgi:hypothetical protein